MAEEKENYETSSGKYTETITPVIPGEVHHTDLIAKPDLTLVTILQELLDYQIKTKDSNEVVGVKLNEFTDRLTNYFLERYNNNDRASVRATFLAYHGKVEQLCKNNLAQEKIALDLSGNLPYILKCILLLCQYYIEAENYMDLWKQIVEVKITNNYDNWKEIYEEHNKKVANGIIATLKAFWLHYKTKVNNQTIAICSAMLYYIDEIEALTKNTASLMENLMLVQNNRIFSKRLDTMISIREVVAKRNTILYYHFLFLSLFNLAKRGDLQQPEIPLDDDLLNQLENAQSEKELNTLLPRLQQWVLSAEQADKDLDDFNKKLEQSSANAQGNTEAADKLRPAITDPDDKKTLADGFNDLADAWGRGANNMNESLDYKIGLLEERINRLQNLLDRLQTLYAGLIALIAIVVALIAWLQSLIDKLRALICKLKQLLCLLGMFYNFNQAVLSPALNKSKDTAKGVVGEVQSSVSSMVGQANGIVSGVESVMRDMAYTEAASQYYAKAQAVANAMGVPYDDAFYQNYKTAVDNAAAKSKQNNTGVVEKISSSVSSYVSESMTTFFGSMMGELSSPFNDWNNSGCDGLRLPDFNLRLPNFSLFWGLPNFSLDGLDFNIRC